MKDKTIFVCFCLLWFTLSCTELPEPTFRIADYKGDRVAAISYTFDDGMLEHYTMVAPEMEKHGFRGTFWVNGMNINEDENNIQNEMKATWGQLKEMAENGHEISNHGWSHVNLKRITLEEVVTEIQKNDTIIYEKTGFFPVTFCYPHNTFDKDIKEIASRNRVGTRTRQYGMGRKTTSEQLEQWGDDLINERKWEIVMIHGITKGYDAFPSADVLWNHLAEVKNREDSIWVGTFREVASYIEEKENFTWEERKGKKSIQIIPQLSLNKDLYKEPLTMVMEREGIKKLTVEQDDRELPVQIYPNKAVFDFNPYGGIITVTSTP